MRKINERELSEVQGGSTNAVSAEPAQAASKIVEDGKVYIIKDGKKYNAAGQLIK